MALPEPSLFPDLEPIAPPPDPLEGLGRDARATIRKDELIRRGINPGTRLPLHARAASGRDGDGLRCGSCTHLYRAEAGNKSFLKCEQAGVYNARHSWGPDMRAWWPACHRYTPTETEEKPAMGTRTLHRENVYCGEDHPPGGSRCPGHTVTVTERRSIDHYEIAVDDKELVLPLALFKRVCELVDEIRPGNELAELRALVDDLTTPAGPCSYDHQGYCEAHGWFNTAPRCPHARAAEITGGGE